MPYKDPERKKEWERLHRTERLARRRQLRQIQAIEQQVSPNPQRIEVGSSAVLIPLIVGSKKGWVWWLVGCVILVLALFFYWRDRRDSKAISTKAESKN